jgi:hypothetical protein
MEQNSNKQARRRKPQEEVVSILAKKYQVSERYIQMVISGESNSQDILEDYLEYKQKHNSLLQEVMRISPFMN